MQHTTTWSSDPIRINACLCVDVKAGPDGVVLGQLHGEHNSFASDLHLTAEQADAIAVALLGAAEKVREGRA